jgi:hypothetical protein
LFLLVGAAAYGGDATANLGVHPDVVQATVILEELEDRPG